MKGVDKSIEKMIDFKSCEQRIWSRGCMQAEGVGSLKMIQSRDPPGAGGWEPSALTLEHSTTCHKGTVADFLL